MSLGDVSRLLRLLDFRDVVVTMSLAAGTPVEVAFTIDTQCI